MLVVCGDLRLDLVVLLAVIDLVVLVYWFV